MTTPKQTPPPLPRRYKIDSRVAEHTVLGETLVTRLTSARQTTGLRTYWQVRYWLDTNGEQYGFEQATLSFEQARDLADRIDSYNRSKV